MKMFVVFVILLHGSKHFSALELFVGDPLIMLPCEFHTFELNDPTVVWSRFDLSPSTVHQRQLQGDELKEQNLLYRGRTSMTSDALETGELSLNLTNLQLSDSGTYTCSIKSFRREWRVGTVQLQVKERFPSWAIALLVLLGLVLIISGGLLFNFRQYFMSVQQVQVDSGVDSVHLPCKTTVKLPVDAKVEWKDKYNRKVHMHQNGSDHPEEQHFLYRNRTSMNKNQVKKGDLSLILKYPTDEDRDTYTCTIYSRNENILMKKDAVLHIKVPQVEVNSEVELVQLPFKTTVHLPEDAKVVWRTTEKKVHLYEDGSDQPEQQNPVYRDRTKMNENLLKTGDLSLILKYPTDWDSGTYTCTIYNREGNILKKKQVKLKVNVCQVDVKEGEESVQLPFKTTQNLPRDAEVAWERIEPNYLMVHMYQNGSDQPDKQDEGYRNQTKMNADFLKTGDLSLTLKNPTETDTGEYTCEVNSRKIHRYNKVMLNVTGRVQVQNKTEDTRKRSDSPDPTPLMADHSV